MSERLRPLLEAAPDAVVVVGHDGRIVLVNRQTCDLFGYAEADLVGTPVEMLLPEELRDQHVHHRGAYVQHPSSRPMAAGRDLHARHRDGRSIPVDIALAPVTLTEGPGVAAYIRDATARRQLAEQARQIREVEVARAHARELNDSIVQGLTTAIWLLEEDAPAVALQAVRETLVAARNMMKDLLGEGAADLADGDLRRQAAPEFGIQLSEPPPVHHDGRGLRLVLADDSRDVRALLRRRLEEVSGLRVVAEAADGSAALDEVTQHRPDVLVLDLSMPVLDGFEVARAVRSRMPEVRIIVLSGHPREQMHAAALAAGADAYVEKGGDFKDVVSAILASASPRPV